MHDKVPCSGSCDRHQFLLYRRRAIHASRSAQTSTSQHDNSGRWGLWTRLSPGSIRRLPTQRLLRGPLLGRRCGSARRCSSPRCGGNSTGSSSSARRARMPSLQRVPMLECLLIELSYDSLDSTPMRLWQVAVGCSCIRPLRLVDSRSLRKARGGSHWTQSWPQTSQHTPSQTDTQRTCHCKT